MRVFHLLLLALGLLLSQLGPGASQLTALGQ
ncbi:beta-defensin precursor [Bos taurus]|uniref:Defensin, beta n=2 Tax=Bos TaxID=9903 RepID=Q29RH1_BOVIN|nr:beta-defensin precursor [Bos taurus]AAI14178.1 Defensin, beta [Bos taurus]DAA14599.1 TPA: beta-defensin [Bos taurus]